MSASRRPRSRIGQRAGVSPAWSHHYFERQGRAPRSDAAQPRGAPRRARWSARLRAARTPRDRVQAVIEATSRRRSSTARTCGVWLAFWGAGAIHSAPRAHPERLIQRRCSRNLRHALRQLPARAPRCSRWRSDLAAMIDGLWLRATLSHAERDRQRRRRAPWRPPSSTPITASPAMSGAAANAMGRAAGSTIHRRRCVDATSRRDLRRPSTRPPAR